MENHLNNFNQEFCSVLVTIWKKIGYSLSVSYSFSVGGFSAARVSEINITNHKDKPITIYSVFLITKDKITIPVEQFNPPKVIKNLAFFYI